MARARVSSQTESDDDLPDLATLVGSSVRRSPRKTVQLDRTQSFRTGHVVVRDQKDYGVPTIASAAREGRNSRQRSLSPRKTRLESEHERESTRSPTRLTSETISAEIKEPVAFRTILGEIPLLPRIDRGTVSAPGQLSDGNVVSISASSHNRLSPKYRHASGTNALKLTHVDSLLLPLSQMALQQSSVSGTDEDVRRSPRKTKSAQQHSQASRFLLQEARCDDDGEDSMPEEDDDETDLSGFIVDDDAELSFHDETSDAASSDSEPEFLRQRRKSPVKTQIQVSPRRRIQRGSPARRVVSSDSESGGGSNKENEKEKHRDDSLDVVMGKLTIGSRKVVNTTSIDTKAKIVMKGVETVDLTFSPVKPPKLDLRAGSDAVRSNKSPVKRSSSRTSDPSDSFESVLKFSPPRSYSPTKRYGKEKTKPESTSSMIPQSTSIVSGGDHRDDRLNTKDKFTTPPTTPPQSPTKLKSPSKLLSPSKKAHIPHSPHRQSMDAFWDLEHVNTWNDTYSPKKAPLTSPAKAFGRFRIWEDSDDDQTALGDGDGSSDSSLPSPCTSPRKHGGIALLGSPLKSPRKKSDRDAKREIAQAKKAAVAEKKAFDIRREQLARDLLSELDAAITFNKLSSLSATTGGVGIVWSKTLRSTAGRANWRRTVTKPSGSPVKGGAANGPGVKVQHYSSIELADKVIDCEERLVNTLAHEFCHLANFMVSGIRDQPHGAEFKKWAAKVTAHLRQSDNDIWRSVEVTTKHGYVIAYKYLWVCAGKEKTQAMEYLNIGEDGSCGAEYGRHSKSIDVERQRCGRCKGRLVQVRPKPRMNSPVKKLGSKSRDGSSGSSADDRDIMKGLERDLDVVELSD